MQRPEKVRKRGDARSSRQRLFPVLAEASSLLDLRLTFDQVEGFAEFIWSQPNSETRVAVGRVRCTGADQLTWEIEKDGQRESTKIGRASCRERVESSMVAEPVR